VLQVTGDEFSIGRDPSNHLCIRDPQVSRTHCLLKTESARALVSDLDSLNGTFVNGVPIHERSLQEGDEVRIGSSLFLFLKDEGQAQAPADAEEAEEETQMTGIQVHPAADALHRQLEKVMGAFPPTTRIARELSAFLKVSAVINSIRDAEKLQRSMLEYLFEVVPAQRGALVLFSAPGREQVASACYWNRMAGPDQSFEISPALIRRILRKGLPFLCCAGTKDQVALDILNDSGARSVLVAPLVFFEMLIGFVYLDTRIENDRFDEDHLQIVTAIAGIVAAPLENLRRVEWLQSENQRLNAAINIERNMVGESPQMQEVYQFIARVASTDSTVLIRGESGTGKELVARAIHQNSRRAGKPFVTINCAALTETLLESELFGHEKGSFTGAIAQKKGKIEVAQGGTVFLDEVGELAPTLQAKLLRVLQEHEVERVGATHPIQVDIRSIAATNRDLEQLVRQGSFRQDLYYRLNVVSIVVPPLRDRRSDIPLLANYFTAKYVEKCKRPVIGISSEVRARLLSYDWPGNVRELENAIEAAIVLGAADVVMPEDLPEALMERESPTGIRPVRYYEAIKEAKKQIILSALEQAGGNYVETANLLGVHPNNLHRLMRNLNLKPPTQRK
jgi:Nif-specific regulatory protein